MMRRPMPPPNASPDLPTRGRSPGRFARLRRGLGSVTASLLALAAPSAVPAPFTYQGRLLDGTTLANGAYEITFRLFDAATAGTPTGPTVLKDPVAVQNGLFTVELDFGAGPFDGSSRWLELAVRPSGGGGTAEILVPRQAILAVPYAMRSFSGSGNASELVSGTVPDARLAPSIARTTDLAATSNGLAAQWAALSTRIEELNASLAAMSNAVQTTIPSGVTVVSADPADPTLTGLGWVPFLTIPSSGWKNAATGGPTARSQHTAVWTGDVAIFWGGITGSGTPSGIGYRYDPDTDAWGAVSEINAPSPRRGHSAVWTPQGMIVWGGLGSVFLANGATYSVASGNWNPLPTQNAPAERDDHLAVWTGARMLVWGGRNATGLLANGGLYDPASQLWSPLANASGVAARQSAAGVWTGTEFIVWGGLGELGELAVGARLPLAGGAVPGSWSLLPTSGAPSARIGHSAVWTGQKLLVWGGHAGASFRGDGAAYDPSANNWQTLPSANAPSPRSGHVAVWTGDEMLVFGGRNA
ncbi:MAG: hypothetical protein JNL97_06330, partial [Verrucomicrobiales bacterium]|nr:hypothetical protein [Verrucomicrobiales bacterium]